MQRRNTGLFSLAVLALLLGASSVLAQPIWPGSDAGWTPLKEPCGAPGVYVEPHGDFAGHNGLHFIDIVGTAAYPAGFVATDGTHLMLRMRVDKHFGAPQYVWQWLFDFTADGNVDYSLQLDDKVDNAVEFVPASPGSPLYAQVNLSHTANDGHWSALVGTGYDRIIATTSDGVDMGDTGPGDSFIDVGIPWADFFSKTGLNPSTKWNGTDPFPYLMHLTTSASHIQVNKDTPLCVGGPGEDPDIPEPATLTLLGLGALGLLRSRRRRRS